MHFKLKLRAIIVPTASLRRSAAHNKRRGQEGSNAAQRPLPQYLRARLPFSYLTHCTWPGALLKVSAISASKLPQYLTHRSYMWMQVFPLLTLHFTACLSKR